ncbi:transposase [Trichonephila clavata]|uniref:Transposase n=1 Tax=Trichonephila clavata TaxID=2740835 RepID=A0A8X6GQ65_TRICU|nr:transposase [Trichonephila clavata]
MKQRKKWVAPTDTPKPRAKHDLHLKKTIICVSWDWESMVHWEILESATVNKELYIVQLHLVKEAIRRKRPHRQGQDTLLHDNVRPHVAHAVKAALQKLEWEVSLNPPYSLERPLMDYHLFRFLSNYMREVTFDNEEDLKNWLNSFSDTRPGDIWRSSIDKLVGRCEEAVNSNGEYI